MNDCLFKSFVIDVCNEHNKPDRVFSKEVVGQMLQYRNFFGVIYNANSNHSFTDITDIKGYMETMNPDMLLLHSRVTDQEVEIYSWKLKDYSIDGNKLTINLDNKTVEFII
jgi:hypothetical protein